MDKFFTNTGGDEQAVISRDKIEEERELNFGYPKQKKLDEFGTDYTDSSLLEKERNIINLTGSSNKEKEDTFRTKISYPIITLYNQPFEVIEEDNLIYLRHSNWPILTGVGKNLTEAEQDLLEEAEAISEAYIYDNESNLSDSAIELKKFLLNIIG